MSKTISSTLKNFLSFVSLFLGTGFIAGSVVHFGEGVNTWDVSVLLVGIFLFIGASYQQEITKQDQKINLKQFIFFIIQSLLLALGIGMASGGTQHFIDTPVYSAILIPLGLSIGLTAYLWREKIRPSLKQSIVYIISLTLSALLLWSGLTYINSIIPESLRQGHGSHGHVSHGSKNDNQTDEKLDDHFNESHEDDGHAH